MQRGRSTPRNMASKVARSRLNIQVHVKLQCKGQRCVCFCVRCVCSLSVHVQLASHSHSSLVMHFRAERLLHVVYEIWTMNINEQYPGAWNRPMSTKCPQTFAHQNGKVSSNSWLPPLWRPGSDGPILAVPTVTTIPTLIHDADPGYIPNADSTRQILTWIFLMYVWTYVQTYARTQARTYVRTYAHVWKMLLIH